MEEFETSNIHLKWLDNIYEQIRNIQAMQRIAREGAVNLMEYFQIPLEVQQLVIPETEYKNLRFLVLEMDLLISNLAKQLPDKKDIKGSSYYREKINKVISVIDNRELFIKERVQKGQLISRELLPFFYQTINYLFSINAELIMDISHILYIPEEEEGKKKW